MNLEIRNLLISAAALAVMSSLIGWAVGCYRTTNEWIARSIRYERTAYDRGFNDCQIQLAAKYHFHRKRKGAK